MAGYTYKCPHCGAPLSWNPGEEKIGCEYCNGQFTVAEVEAYNQEQIAREAARDERREAVSREAEQQQAYQREHVEGHVRAYHCDSCGAEVVTDDETSATFCYYCHNPVILTDRVSGEFRPQSIVPFTVTREQAEQRFLKWARSKRFVPASFYSTSQLEKMTGLYLPYWVGRAEAHVHLAGTGEVDHTTSTSTERITETQVYGFNREGDLEFRNMAEVAYDDKNDRFDPKLTATIANYKLEEAVPFAMPYLSGFYSEMRSVDEDTIRPVLEQRSKQYIDEAVKDAVGLYDRVDLKVNEVEGGLEDVTYTLLPAWVLTYYYAGKTYMYAINGQTGEAFGELPVDKKRLGIWSLVLALILIALFLAGGRFIW